VARTREDSGWAWEEIVSRSGSASSGTWEEFAFGRDPFEMSWYVGTAELVEQVAWRVCRACEVYWIGQPRCWLCQRAAESGFPRLEPVAARNPVGGEIEILY
jgi:hypothetical protein